MSEFKESEIAKIPEYLLANVSPPDKWLMENVFELKQNVNSLGETVSRVEKQCLITNGRVTSAENDIVKLENEIKSWSSFKKSVFKIVGNKYFLAIMVAIVFIALYPVVSYVIVNGGLAKFVVTNFKLLFG